MNIIKLWNLYADGESQWESLTEAEKLMFAMSIEREACAKLCEDAPEPDGADLAERIRARGTT